MEQALLSTLASRRQTTKTTDRDLSYHLVLYWAKTLLSNFCSRVNNNRIINLAIIKLFYQYWVALTGTIDQVTHLEVLSCSVVHLEELLGRRFVPTVCHMFVEVPFLKPRDLRDTKEFEAIGLRLILQGLALDSPIVGKFSPACVVDPHST